MPDGDTAIQHGTSWALPVCGVARWESSKRAKGRRSTARGMAACRIRCKAYSPYVGVVTRSPPPEFGRRTRRTCFGASDRAALVTGMQRVARSFRHVIRRPLSALAGIGRLVRALHRDAREATDGSPGLAHRWMCGIRRRLACSSRVGGEPHGSSQRRGGLPRRSAAFGYDTDISLGRSVGALGPGVHSRAPNSRPPRSVVAAGGDFSLMNDEGNNQRVRALACRRSTRRCSAQAVQYCDRSCPASHRGYWPGFGRSVRSIIRAMSEARGPRLTRVRSDRT
jgi:hypothetical protein